MSKIKKFLKKGIKFFKRVFTKTKLCGKLWETKKYCRKALFSIKGLFRRMGKQKGNERTSKKGEDKDNKEGRGRQWKKSEL